MRDPAVPPYQMSVGRSRPTDDTKCDIGCGCSATDCIQLAPYPYGYRDHLHITGGVFKNKKANVKNPDEFLYTMSDYYCGTGLGMGSMENGTDDGTGVFTQAPGPVQLRYCLLSFSLEPYMLY